MLWPPFKQHSGFAASLYHLWCKHRALCINVRPWFQHNNVFTSFFCFSPSTSGGVSRSSHLRGDSEHLALRDHAAAGQLPAGGHASELHQLRLSQRGRRRARRRWAPRARPANPRQEIQHVRRPATGTLKPQTAGARFSYPQWTFKYENHTFLFWLVSLLLSLPLSWPWCYYIWLFILIIIYELLSQDREQLLQIVGFFVLLNIE